MIRVLLDANVLVAALRSKTGASAELLRRLADGKFDIVTSVALHLEYEEQLARLVELDIATRAQALDVLNFISLVAVPTAVPFRLRPSLPDPDDEFAVELAVAAKVQCIVTYNRADFRAASRYGIDVVSPAELLRRLEDVR